MQNGIEKWKKARISGIQLIDCGVSLVGDIQNPPWRSCVDMLLGKQLYVALLDSVLYYMTSRGPFQYQLFGDSEKGKEIDKGSGSKG